MSEAVLVAIITGIPALIAAILGFLNKRQKADLEVIDVSDKDMESIKSMISQIISTNENFMEMRVKALQAQINAVKKSQYRLRNALLKSLDTLSSILSEEDNLKDVTRIRINSTISEITASVREGE